MRKLLKRRLTSQASRQHSFCQSVLHPRIADKAWLAFVRGEYDNAIFGAMKQVEVAVRTACGYSHSEIGVPLMRKAFEVSSGPLTDLSVVAAEREALQHLFAGAIGCYTNPRSHRDVDEDDPAVAIELILLASHLLRIVDARTGAKRASHT